MTSVKTMEEPNRPICHSAAGNGRRDGARAERSYGMVEGCDKSRGSRGSQLPLSMVCLVAKFPVPDSRIRMEDAYRLGDCVPVSGGSQCRARKIDGPAHSGLTHSQYIGRNGHAWNRPGACVASRRNDENAPELSY